MKPVEELSGRALDAAVAFEVMGFVWWKSHNVFGDPQHYLSRAWYHRGDTQCEYPGKLYMDWDRNVPAYSTEWAVVKDVVGKLCETAEPCFYYSDEEWECDLGDGEGNYGVEQGISAKGKTLPEAVARCAVGWARKTKAATS